MSFPNWLPKQDSSLDFPLENLPIGVFSESTKSSRPGVALGDHVIDLAVLQDRGFFTGPILSKELCFAETTLNAFMGLGKSAWMEARTTLQRLFSSEEGTIRDQVSLRNEVLRPMSEVKMHVPARIGDFTDFYASKQHASTIGAMFRNPQEPLTPNWVHLPVAYHGRSSSVVISGTDIPRPYGQTKSAQEASPVYGPSSKVDFELEMGVFVGPGNSMGAPIGTEEAMDHCFGMVLLNDWSARDVQQWEAVPLGPFTSKNWATSISPWIVPTAALEPFLCEAPVQNPTVLPYLDSKNHLTYDIQLEATQKLSGEEPKVVTKSNLKYIYWTLPQMIAHHTSTGCNLLPGDLLGTGTISSPGGRGCIVEMTYEEPTRQFLRDGEEVVLTGWCENSNGLRIGFGECKGTILPAK